MDLTCVTRPLGINRPLDMLPLLNAIELLRGDEGSSVTFINDNADFNGQPNSKVICNGGWTGWEDRTFVGETAFEALGEAVRAYGGWMDEPSRTVMDAADPINLAGSGPVPIEPREG